jgi:hypothetical protein
MESIIVKLKPEQVEELRTLFSNIEAELNEEQRAIAGTFDEKLKLGKQKFDQFKEIFEKVQIVFSTYTGIIQYQNLPENIALKTKISTDLGLSEIILITNVRTDFNEILRFYNSNKSINTTEVKKPKTVNESVKLIQSKLS